MTEEVRVTNESTGGQKGQKLARYDLVPGGPLLELAELYGKGAKKYADRNWERGYDWNLSFAALQRHAWAFWNGEDLIPQTPEGEPDDPTAGSKHMIAVAWHALALAQFMDEHRELDTRPIRCEDGAKEDASAAKPGATVLSFDEMHAAWENGDIARSYERPRNGNMQKWVPQSELNDPDMAYWDYDKKTPVLKDEVIDGVLVPIKDGADGD